MIIIPTGNDEVKDGRKHLAKELISYFIKNNNLAHIEIQMEIDKIVLDGFDDTVGTEILKDAISEGLLLTMSERIRSDRSDKINEAANFHFDRNNTPSHISVSRINVGSFPLINSDNKLNTVRLANDVSRAIVKGLTTFNGK
jgi:hypothetical protein